MLIILGPGGGAIVRKNTLAGQLGPDKRDIPMNHGMEDLCVTTLLEDGSDVGGERGPRIEFRQQDMRGLACYHFSQWWCRPGPEHRAPRMDSPLQALPSLSGTRPNRVSTPYTSAPLHL